MQHSLLSWIQIPTIDIKRAAKFYGDVFDLEFSFETLNGMPHAVVKPVRGVKPINGTLIQSENQKPGGGPVLFFDATGKFDDFIERIEASGGSVQIGKTLIHAQVDEQTNLIPKTHIDDNEGYFARFTDSEGNKMGLYGSS